MAGGIGESILLDTDQCNRQAFLWVNLSLSPAEKASFRADALAGFESRGPAVRIRPPRLFRQNLLERDWPPP
jgi:hypothetical protein